ncbi:MAG TPA: type III secretion system export apparatus subunit SctR [Beijerinckiaceae bacterium]|nr:type III secretion system export apparatus subunit SctR [Beijerinckiaceae bacterium]
MDNFNVVGVFAVVLLTGLAPMLVMMLTSFAKISVVLFIVRNALGIQQTPPNILLYGLALVLTAYVMMPVGREVYAVAADPRANYSSVAGIERTVIEAGQPVRTFLMKHTKPRDRQFFVDAAQKVWKDARQPTPHEADFIVLIPAFISAELTRAFEIGFLLYLPFVMIDFAVSAILVAVGMQMMSPTVISTPFKLLLFVILEGWSYLLQGLILSYA